MSTKIKISEIKVSYCPRQNETIQITNSKSAFKVISMSWDHRIIQFQEEFKVLLLNNANHVLGIYSASKGGINSSIVDIRIILSVALKCNTSGIIMIHNHPSGNLKPSSADIDITSRLKSACKLLEIELLDHLIITRSNYYSFADEGLL